MATAAEIGAAWRAFLGTVENNLYAVTFPFASLCAGTYIAAAAKLGTDDPNVEVIGKHLGYAILAFIISLLLRLIASEPPKPLQDRIATGLAYAAIVGYLVYSLFDIGTDLAASATVRSHPAYKSLEQWRSCHDEKQRQFDRASDQFDAAHAEVKQCLSQRRSEQFTLDLAIEKREISGSAAKSRLQTEVQNRCNAEVAGLKKHTDAMNKWRAVECLTPPALKQ